ncbi:MAG: O-antigen ligase family protein [bacterium]|nr:O-antigen ligase family protein [bacterium]
MTSFSPVGRLSSLPRIAKAVGWAAAAVGLGLLVGTASPTAAALILGAFVLAIFTIFSPFAPLTFLLISAPIRTLFATESPVQIPLDIGQWLLIVSILAWLFHTSLFRQALPRVRLSTVLGLVIGFTAAGALSAFGAYSTATWLLEWLKWVQILILIVLVCDLAHARRWEHLIAALVAAGLVNAIIGIYQYFGGSGADHLIINERFFRAFGTFGQPNPFGGFMGLIAPIAVASTLGYALRSWAAFRVTRQWSISHLFHLAFYGLSSIVIAAALFMSYSRGAWLGFGISMIGLMFAVPRKVWQGAALIVVIGLGAALLWMSGRLPASITDRVASATQETFSFTDVRSVEITGENYALVERLAHWQAALNMAQTHPFTGVGLGNYEVAYDQFRLINWKFPLGHAHNYYLNVFAETGIIGLWCYLVMWGGIIVLTWRMTRRHPDLYTRLTAAGLLGTWLYLSAHSLTDNLYVNNLFIHIGVMLGILAALSPEQFTHSVGKRMAWGSRIPSG